MYISCNTAEISCNFIYLSETHWKEVYVLGKYNVEKEGGQIWE